MDLLETNNADEFVERQAIGVSEHRRIRRETSHRGQSTMDLFDGHRDMVLDWFPVQQDKSGSKLWRETFNNETMWRETFNNETTVKGNLCCLTDTTDA